MKRFFNYVACSLLLFIALFLTFGGGWWSLCGFAFDGMLFASGQLWPKFWEMFWVSNTKILSYFNCL